MNPVPGSITVVVARDFSYPDLDYRTPFLLFRHFDIYTPAGCRLPATAPTVAGHSPREHGQCPCADPELVSFQGPPKRPADHRPMHRIYLAQTEHVTALDTFDGEDHLRVQGWIVHCGHSAAPHTDQGPRIERLGQSGKHSTPSNHDETCKKTKKAIKKSSREAVGFPAARDYAYRTVGRLAWCHGTSSFNFRRAASISLVADPGHVLVTTRADRIGLVRNLTRSSAPPEHGVLLIQSAHSRWCSRSPAPGAFARRSSPSHSDPSASARRRSGSRERVDAMERHPTVPAPPEDLPAHVVAAHRDLAARRAPR